MTLDSWASFYVIVGSSAGVLIGLTFVVITLLPSQRINGTNWGISTFNTPTVTHLVVALFLCADLGAPWPARWEAALALGVCGLGGLVYSVIVLRRMRLRLNYEPVLEDWIFFGSLPIIIYTMLIVVAFLLRPYPTLALFMAGGAALLLLFTGIHNTWDLVTWISLGELDQLSDSNQPEEPTQPGEKEM